MSLRSEEEIIAAAQIDLKDFVPLYDLYVERVFWYAYRMTGDEDAAKDATSATFENALRNIHKYRYRGISFVAWLYRIARNEVFQDKRRQRNQIILNPSLKSNVDVEGQVVLGFQYKVLRSALWRLPEQDRDLLILRFWEGLNSAQVAEVMGCSPQTLYVRLHRALARLRAEYEELEKAGSRAAGQGNQHVY